MTDPKGPARATPSTQDKGARLKLTLSVAFMPKELFLIIAFTTAVYSSLCTATLRTDLVLSQGLVSGPDPS